MSIIYGNNTVKNALINNRVIKLYKLETFNNKEVLELAKKFSVKVVTITKQEIDSFCKNKNHQGIIAEVKPYQTYQFEPILAKLKNKSNSLLVILDELNDPHNLGAILRSSDVFGVDGIIYKKNGQVGLNDTVSKVSTGAIDYVPCIEVTNLSMTIEKLKKEGFWIIGLAGEAKSDLKSIPKDVKLAVVIGSEGKGISQLVRKHCDLLVKIPMLGHVSCLNASVAAGIVLYHIRNNM